MILLSLNIGTNNINDLKYNINMVFILIPESVDTDIKAEYNNSDTVWS